MGIGGGSSGRVGGGGKKAGGQWGEVGLGLGVEKRRLRRRWRRGGCEGATGIGLVLRTRWGGGWEEEGWGSAFAHSWLRPQVSPLSTPESLHSESWDKNRI